MRLFSSLVLAVAFIGCVATPAFQPTTPEGAQCKERCAHNMQSCRGSSYTCDRAYSKCIEACRDTENVAKAAKPSGAS